MEARQHHDLLRGQDVENAKWESTEQSAAYLLVDCGEGEWIALDRVETLLERLKKLVTKVRASLSIPRDGAVDVRFCRPREAEAHFLRLREPRICDHGRVASGSLR